MFIQYGVRLIGAFYLALGVLGSLPVDALNPVHHQGVGAHYLLNIIAINTVHNLIHLTLGATALWAAKTLAGAQRWGIIGGTVLIVLFVAGMVQAVIEGFPIDQSLFSLVPLNSPGHILHLVSGGLALYLGLVRYNQWPQSPDPGRPR